ncbi:hypothetical protein [Pedobacter psychrodurus]|uniref:hypothetical protein n=1 Tax=Pedobacter psychrodurus TaxID=2530456 RepID=UPI0029307A90|nr:hypothetical protein [Pedobacter psychrodurus]
MKSGFYPTVPACPSLQGEGLTKPNLSSSVNRVRFLKSKAYNSSVAIALLYIPIFLIGTVMLRDEASVSSAADASSLSMTIKFRVAAN